MAQPPPRPLPPATAARIIWLALIGGAILFLVVGTFVRWSYPGFGEPSLHLLSWIALGVALAGLLASRALARRPAPTDPSRVLGRMITQLSLCDVGVLLAGVAWLLTGAAVALLAAAVGLLGMALAFPRASALEAAGQPGHHRMVR
jgi:hypothetical protein